MSSSPETPSPQPKRDYARLSDAVPGDRATVQRNHVVGDHIKNLVSAMTTGLGLADLLLAGIRPDQAARLPRFESAAGAVVVNTNHPVFVYGHLALYPAKAAAMLGLPSVGLATPPAWEEVFKAGAPCKDDPAGTIYPAWEQVHLGYKARTAALMVAMESLDDAVLLKPTPDERTRTRFPLIGGAVTFYVTSHVMMHLGQVSAWRRCFGLPSAM